MTSSGLAPRRAVLDMIDATLRKQRSLDHALASATTSHRLSDQDRALARHLIATLLRRLGEIDAVIDYCLDKPLPGRAKTVRDLLRIGLVQLFFSEVADHAALNTTVALAEGTRLSPYRKLVNAILRRAQREGAQVLSTLDAPKLNTPAWLWESWVEAYGEKTTRAIAKVHMAGNPPLDLTLKNSAETALWAERLGADVLPTGSLRLREFGPVETLPGFDEGAWWVQDAAAALPVKLFGDLKGKRVLDLCAAPGGKTLQLAAAGARVTALDRSGKRLKRLRENLKRTGLTATVIEADALEWEPDAPFDAILLDAPCSATGTIRRHPELPYQRNLEDIERLSELQLRLLRWATNFVKPDGQVIYATCSLQPEEGPAQLQTLKSVSSELRTSGIHSVNVPDEFGETALRTLPSQWLELRGLDGFFATCLTTPCRIGTH